MGKETHISREDGLLRRLMAYQLRNVRQADRENKYINNRDLYDYLLLLGGLSSFLTYTKTLGDNGLLLDVGAGTTRAVSQLEKSNTGHGLNYRAVVLTRKKEIGDYLGYEKTLITPAERLRGVEDGSVSGIISLHGIPYSASEQASAASIDRVLVPGGVIKIGFSFPQSGPAKHNQEVVEKPSGHFIPIFLEMGYDVSVSERFKVIMLAIKPGGGRKISAEQLLASDSGREDALKQLRGEF